MVGAWIMYLGYTGHSFFNLLLFASPFLLIFITSSISMILFGEGQTTWFQFGLIHVTEESFYRGLHLGMRSMIFGLLGLLFALTTRPVLLFYSLMQQFKLKPKFAYSFMAAVRILPIMLEEFQSLRHALKVRGVTYQKGVKGFYQKLQQYVIPLLAQSIRRAHRIAVAMEAKKFSGDQQRTYYYKLQIGKYDLYFTLLLISWVSITFYLTNFISIIPIDHVRSTN